MGVGAREMAIVAFHREPDRIGCYTELLVGFTRHFDHVSDRTANKAKNVGEFFDAFVGFYLDDPGGVDAEDLLVVFVTEDRGWSPWTIGVRFLDLEPDSYSGPDPT